MKKKAIWLSYDLGIRGDYSGLYSLLDNKEAKECGDNTAFINYKYEDDLLTSLKEEIESSVDLNNNSRIYISWMDKKADKNRGKFLFGRRKQAP